MGVDVVRSRVPVFVFVPHPVVRMAVPVDEVGRAQDRAIFENVFRSAGGEESPILAEDDDASGTFFLTA